MSKLSVIILTKNEERNILDCLETIISADEIIIVDDYSEDRTLEVIKNLKKRNIKVFKKVVVFMFLSCNMKIQIYLKMQFFF